MEIEGIVSKIIYRNESNQYTVLSLEITDGDEETLVGYMSGIDEGMYIRATGEYTDNASYGMQLKVESFEVSMPGDMESMVRYLGSGVIKGIGQVMAKRIVKKFREDTFRIIEEEPDRLAEIKGISEKKAREIAIEFMEKQETREALMFLSGYNISPALSMKIINEYGQRLYDVIKKNPYQIAEDIPGVGFKTADNIAMSSGIGELSEYRIRAALIYVVNQAASFGHTYLPKDLLVYKTGELLTGGMVDPEFHEEIEELLNNLAMEKKLIIKEEEADYKGKEEIIEKVYSLRSYSEERTVARMLLETKATLNISDLSIDKVILDIEKEEKITLDEKQREAVKEAAKQGVLVITGGPGTGKTTTINAIIKYFENEGMEILLAAPTGRAAKRMTEATGCSAQTIHRMLELTGMDSEGEAAGGARFERNASNPLDCDVVIIDEMSMVDISLMKALMSAIVPGTHLILVGDENQLPSVGPGNVLKDIIKSGKIPKVSLEKIFRQKDGSLIVENAHKINKGQPIALDNKSEDFFFVPISTVPEIISYVAKLLSKKLPSYVGCEALDIQVLTPMRKGELGVESLNAKLQEVLNPKSLKKREKETGSGTIFREGDKVMQIRNNYKLNWSIYTGKGRFKEEEGVGVFNGDMGIIKEIDTYNEEVVVLFDDEKEVKYPYSGLDELELAYATTIHKAQGSEYPAVIMPLFSGPKVLLTRNLLYTGVTRAKKCVVTVGNGHIIADMIQNNDEQRRYSTLSRRIVEMAENGF